MQKRFIYNGLPVSYTDAGSGVAILLIHGFAEDAGVWHYQQDYLQDTYRVIAINVPGSGQSAYNASLCSMNDYADVVYAMLQHENIEKCIMLGHSMGGYITLAFAEKYLQRLAGFGFVHSTAFADSDDKKQARLKGIKAIGELGAAAFVKNTTPNLFTAKFKNQHANLVEGLVAKGANFTGDALQQYYQAMMTRPDRTAFLKNSPVPVLFIIGDEDTAVPLTDSLKQAHLPGTSHIHILEGTGHMGFWEQADKTNRHIEDFAAYAAQNAR